MKYRFQYLPQCLVVILLYWSIGSIGYAHGVTHVLIGSPVRQKPAILHEFLLSLIELEKEGLIVDYCFVNDNIVSESNDILENFSLLPMVQCTLLLLPIK